MVKHDSLKNWHVTGTVTDCPGRRGFPDMGLSGKELGKSCANQGRGDNRIMLRFSLVPPRA